jgi:ribosomal protein S18 acetylase RimI-like enzyme
MINKISSKTNKKVLERLVDIHQKCILESNSKYYNNKQIKEWLSTINIQNITNQIENTYWIMLKEGNKIVGFAQYSTEDREIYQIQIDPQEQGYGYGKRLYEYIEEEFKQNNIPTISLFATLNAVLFYKKVGFKVIKNIKFQLINTEIDMVEMSKSLI